MTVTLSTKGQLVIPAQIRKALNLNAGDQVILKVEGQRLVLEPASRPKAKLKRGKFGRVVLEAPPDAPPMTTESVKKLLEELA